MNTPFAFSARQKELVALFARYSLPRGGAFPLGADDLPVAEKVEALVAGCPWEVRIGVGIALFMMEWMTWFIRGTFFVFGPLFFLVLPGRPGRFTKMNPETQDRFLRHWKEHRVYVLRALFISINSFCQMVFYSEPQVMDQMGYDGYREGMNALSPGTPKPSETLLASQAPRRQVTRTSFSLKSEVRQYRDFKADEEVSCEVVVIGSGAGGAVFAHEMAAAGRDVVLIEEGSPYERADFGRDPVNVSMKMYRQAGITAALGMPGVVLPLGRTVGGTTTVNSGTCFRTPEVVIDEWRDAGLTDVTARELSPFFQKIEDRICIQPVAYEIMGRNNILFKEGADKLGFSGEPLKRNYSDCKGSGHCAFGCPEDAKLSMNISYIPDAIRKGARVWANTRAISVLHERGRACGVRAMVEDPEGTGPTYEVRIRAKVVALAGGTIPSPFFLLQNRLCNSSGMVGKNFRCHPAAKIMAMFDEPVYGWRGVPQSYGMNALWGEGLMFEGFFVPPAMVAFALPGFGHDHKEVMGDFKHLAGFGVMVHDSTAGRVSRMPFVPGPVITYQVNDKDFSLFRLGVATAARCWFAAGARKVFTPFESIKVLEKESDIERVEKASLRKEELELIAFHPMGTCQFGKDRRRSVVNPELESHDLKNFFIVDGSVFPTSLGVNPQESIMCFSMMAAGKILARADKYFSG